MTERKYSDDNRFQEQLRAKIAGELETSSQKELDEIIAQSPEAAEEARFSSKLGMALRHEEKLQLNAIIGAIIAEEGVPPAKPKSGPGSGAWGRWLIWLTGLVVVGISIGVGYQLLISYNQPDVGQYYESHFKPLENVIITPQQAGSLNELDRGMDAYDRGDYERAAELLGQYYGQTGDPNAGLFLGVTQLQIGRHHAAISTLQNSLRGLQAPALDAGRWYLALAYLKTGELLSARDLLRLIPAESVYGDQAGLLFSELERLK